MSGRPAVFLDRDGTIIEAVHYLSDPSAVRLFPGAGQAIARLRAAGYACVLITNQSAIGRGLLTVEGLHQVHAELCRQLEAQGALLDGFYFCPTVPTSDDRTVVDDTDRKPSPGMILRAAEELRIDLRKSWMVGDMVSDVLAGWNAGCRGSIFVTCGQGRPEDLAMLALDRPAALVVVDDLAAATDHILETDSRPASSL